MNRPVRLVQTEKPVPLAIRPLEPSVRDEPPPGSFGVEAIEGRLMTESHSTIEPLEPPPFRDPQGGISLGLFVAPQCVSIPIPCDPAQTVFPSDTDRDSSPSVLDVLCHCSIPRS